MKHFPNAVKEAVSNGLSGLFALFVCDALCLDYFFFFFNYLKISPFSPHSGNLKNNTKSKLDQNWT